MSVQSAVCVCLQVNPRPSHELSPFMPIFTFFRHFTVGRGSFFLCRRTDTLCRSSFADDVL